MNGATYHVTTPAQLAKLREQQRLAEERLARSVERIAQLTRSMCTQPPAPLATGDAKGMYLRGSA